MTVRIGINGFGAMLEQQITTPDVEQPPTVDSRTIPEWVRYFPTFPLLAVLIGDRVEEVEQ